MSEDSGAEGGLGVHSDPIGMGSSKPDAAGSSPVELIRALAVLAEPPTVGYDSLAGVIGLQGTPDPAEFSDLFLFQLYPYASVHLGAEGMMGGEARDRVAGFWRAIGRTPPPEPDHLAALLGLYVTLAERGTAGEGAEDLMAGQAKDALLREHLAPWVFAYLERVRELTRGFYADWADLLSRTLRRELASASKLDQSSAAETLPLHLREAPGLPDPRSEGGDGFLQAMLAPVRCGVILTRADLARIAGDLDLGLRAGERRYALEHLLGQEPVSVLQALGEEARRQGETHATRASWLGVVADFFARRANDTAALLAALAEEGSVHLETAAVGATVEAPTAR